MHPLQKLLLASSLLVSSLLCAKAPLEVDRVNFNNTGDDWVQMEVKIDCNENTLPGARNPDFVSDIKVTAYLTYESDDEPGQYSFYMSEVEIVAMERRESYNVYFYLPGLIVERDNLKDEPQYYYVELSIGGETLPPVLGESMSRNIRDNPPILKSMIDSSKAQAAVNEGILMPVYYAPAQYLGRISDMPVYRRYNFSPNSQ